MRSLLGSTCCPRCALSTCHYLFQIPLQLPFANWQRHGLWQRSQSGIRHSPFLPSPAASAEPATLPCFDQMHSALTYKSGTVLEGAGRNQQQRGKIKGNSEWENGTKESFKSTWLWIYMYLLLRGMRGVAAFKRIHIFSGFWMHIAPRKTSSGLSLRMNYEMKMSFSWKLKGSC